MARMGEFASVAVLVLVVALRWEGIPRAVEAQQLGLTHKFAHLQGSSAKSGGKGISPDYFETLKAHDRRRLAAVLAFPLNGSISNSGLYYTQISLGTPVRHYMVFVDTGSDLMWLNCAPCPTCPSRTDINGVKLTQYDPSLSSTDKVLPCASPECQIASSRTTSNPRCTDPVSPNACSYEIGYVDGSSSNGYLLNDVMTFNLVVNGTNTASPANVYFGCGHNQTGHFQSGSFNVDGVMGFGTTSITIPNQVANQKKTGRMFAHCLQGSDVGGGIIVMGNITEPDIVYTPIVQQSSYYVSMQNIAVNGVNITTPASFDISQDGRGGTVMDSGTTLALLIQPAHDEFVAAVSKNVSVPLQQINWASKNGATDCFVYNGSIVGTFPEVELFFKGGAVMNLVPKNYLIQVPLDNGETALCFAWLPSTDITLFGDIVLVDQLVVYDIDKQRVGWKPFDCNKSISVEIGTGVLPRAQAPGPRPGGDLSGAQDSRTRMSTYLLSSCLAFAFLRTLM